MPATERAAIAGSATPPFTAVPTIPGQRPPVQEHLFGVDDAGHGKAVFRLVVLNAVAADQQNARLPHLVESAAEDLAEDADIHLADRETDDIHRGNRPSAHRIDIPERIRHGDPTEGVRIIHDRGEKIDGLDDGQVVAEPVNPGILGMLHADDQVRIGNERQILQRFLQVPRTYLAGSPGSVDRFRQPHLSLFVHLRSPSRNAKSPRRRIDNLSNPDQYCEGNSIRRDLLQNRGKHGRCVVARLQRFLTHADWKY